MNEIQQAELQEWGDLPVEERQHFEITNMESLTWAFRKLAAYKAKENEIAKIAQQERDRIDDWEAEQKKSIQGDMEFFEGLIQRYHAKQLAENPKAKTLSTPFGKSKSRTSKPAPEKTDEDEIIDYLTQNDLFDYIKTSVKWGELKKNLEIAELEGKRVAVDTSTGIPVPGIEIRPEKTTFSIEVRK